VPKTYSTNSGIQLLCNIDKATQTPHRAVIREINFIFPGVPKAHPTFRFGSYLYPFLMLEAKSWEKVSRSSLQFSKIMDFCFWIFTVLNKEQKVMAAAVWGLFQCSKETMFQPEHLQNAPTLHCNFTELHKWNTLLKSRCKFRW